jgi:hypothetical protein
MAEKELYSRDLSSDAKEKLIDFLEAYIETLLVAEVDEKAEVAKEKAVEVLKTDIDILNFVNLLWSVRGQLSTIVDVKDNRMSPRAAAKLLVEIFDKARIIDKSLRTLPPGSGIRFT